MSWWAAKQWPYGYGSGASETTSGGNWADSSLSSGNLRQTGGIQNNRRPWRPKRLQGRYYYPKPGRRSSDMYYGGGPQRNDIPTRRNQGERNGIAAVNPVGSAEQARMWSAGPGCKGRMPWWWPTTAGAGRVTSSSGLPESTSRPLSSHRTAMPSPAPAKNCVQCTPSQGTPRLNPPCREQRDDAADSAPNSSLRFQNEEGNSGATTAAVEVRGAVSGTDGEKSSVTVAASTAPSCSDAKKCSGARRNMSATRSLAVAADPGASATAKSEESESSAVMATSSRGVRVEFLTQARLVEVIHLVDSEDEEELMSEGGAAALEASSAGLPPPLGVSVATSLANPQTEAVAMGTKTEPPATSSSSERPNESQGNERAGGSRRERAVDEVSTTPPSSRNQPEGLKVNLEDDGNRRAAMGPPTPTPPVDAQVENLADGVAGRLWGDPTDPHVAQAPERPPTITNRTGNIIQEDILKIFLSHLSRSAAAPSFGPLATSLEDSSEASRANTTSKKRKATMAAGLALTGKRQRVTRSSAGSSRTATSQLQSTTPSRGTSGLKSAVVAIKIFRDSIYYSFTSRAFRHDLTLPSRCDVEYEGRGNTLNSLEVYVWKQKAEDVYATSQEGELLRYDPDTGNCTGSFPIGAAIRCSALAWRHIYLGLDTGEITAFSVKSKKKDQEKSYQCFEEAVSCIRAAAKGEQKLVCAVSVRGSLAVCDESTGIRLWKHDGQFVPRCIGINKGCIYVTTPDQKMHLYRLQNGTVRKSFSCQRAAVGVYFYYKSIIYCSHDGQTCVYRINGKDLDCKGDYGSGDNRITCMDVSGSLIATGNSQGQLEVFELVKSNLQHCQTWSHAA